MKRILPIVVSVAFVLLIGGGFFLWRGRKASQVSVGPTPTPEGTLIETTLEERPYVTLTPRADGKEFTLEISRIKNAKTIEYELVYLAKGLSRGVVGSINLQGETEISRDLLLGTCSRNVCKYDEGVEEGTLTLRFRGADGVRKFISDFRLQEGDEELSSTDGKFKLEGQFLTDVFYITMSTVGLPEEIEEEVIGGPYGVFGSGSTKIRDVELTLELAEEISGAKLYSWSGGVWQEEDFEIEGKTLSASVNSLATFIAVSSE